MSASVARRLFACVMLGLRGLTSADRLVLLGVAVLHVIGIGWGLPGAAGWDVDGIAPQDFLPGVVKTFTPGEYFTYPPLHLVFLTVLTLPITLVVLARAPSLSRADLIHSFTQVPVMTSFAFAARFVSALMSLGLVFVIGRMATAIFGPRARPWAMAIAGVEVAGTYYGHTTNLDMPALFWSSCALLALIRAVQNDDPRRLWRVAVLASCAIATKDQAYAVFAFAVPCVMLAWLVIRWRSGRVRELARAGAMSFALALALVLFLDGALFNPSGFAARLRFLSGPASQDFAQYSRDWPGRLAAVWDAATFLPQHYPIALAPVFVLGAIFAAVRAPAAQRLAALIPLLAIVSFTLTFNAVAQRVEERFMMPQMQLLAVYGGGAVSGLLGARPASDRPLLGWLVRLGALACVALGLRQSLTVVANMLGDSRYDAERFLGDNVRPDDVVEVYGKNVYLPRFTAGATVQRVGEDPTDMRSPIPGVTELQARVGAVDQRKPRWIVVSSGYAWRFLQRSRDAEGGRVLPEAQRVLLADSDATSYFGALFTERAGYRVAHVAVFQGSRWFPPRPLHASLACDIFIFERR